MKVNPIGSAGNWSLLYSRRYFHSCKHCNLKRILKKFRNCPRCGRPIIQEKNQKKEKDNG